jgi:hypothetical protein
LHRFFWLPRPATGGTRNERILYRLPLIAAAAVAIVGCRPEPQIHSYQVPKERAPARPVDEAADASPATATPSSNMPAARMLAAIVLRPGAAWFFKMSGPLASVTAHAEEFEKFIPTLQFAGDAPPEWETPAGWTQAASTGPRFATLKSPVDSSGAEIAITMLPFTGGAGAAADDDYLISNINRWRGQLMLAPITAPQLGAETKRVETRGASAIVVDLVGKLAPTGMGSPGMAGPAMGGAGMGGSPQAPFAATAPKADAAPRPGRMLAAIVLRSGDGWFFKLSGPAAAVSQHVEAFQKLVASLRFDDQGIPSWQAPDDWTSGPTNPMRYATLIVPNSPTPLDLTISKLPYAGPDPLDYALKNVNRWRDQLQLPHTTREQLSADLQRVSLAEGEALVVDLADQQSSAGAAGAAETNATPPAPGAQNGN